MCSELVDYTRLYFDNKYHIVQWYRMQNDALSIYPHFKQLGFWISDLNRNLDQLLLYHSKPRQILFSNSPQNKFSLAFFFRLANTPDQHTSSWNSVSSPPSTSCGPTTSSTATTIKPCPSGNPTSNLARKSCSKKSARQPDLPEIQNQLGALLIYSTQQLLHRVPAASRTAVFQTF